MSAEPVVRIKCPFCEHVGMRFWGGIKKAHKMSRGRGEKERFPMECNGPRDRSGKACDGLRLSRHRLVLAALEEFR